MPRPRKQQICLSATSYYHCTSRCVRRAFLCGKDALTGRSFEHRRGWVERRLLLLGSVFAIDVCAYAVMSNHTHIVLHVNQEQACSWNAEEIIRRWHRIQRGTSLTRKFVEKDKLSEAELETVMVTAEVYRKRLFDVSWFMRLLNEFIARKANREDECTGRFWEGRFTSQALLDDRALAACMAYVDLNPIRSGLATSPSNAKHTSLNRRIRCQKEGRRASPLLPFKSERSSKNKHLPFNFSDYRQQVEQTAEILVGQSKEKYCLPLLKSMSFTFQQWQSLTSKFEALFNNHVGSPESIENFVKLTGLKRPKNVIRFSEFFDIPTNAR